MAYDEGTAERIRFYFRDHPSLEEKKMFGGLCIMLRGHMCVGIVSETLMVRVGPDQYGEALKRPHAREMDFTGKPMRGFVFVDPEGFESDDDLQGWIDIALAFNKTLNPQ